MTAWLDELELVPPSLADSSLEVALSLEAPSVEPSLEGSALQTLSLASVADDVSPFDEASLEQTLLEESSSKVTVSYRSLSTA